MQERKQIGILMGFVMSVSLLAAFFTALFMALSYEMVWGKVLLCTVAGLGTAGGLFIGTVFYLKWLTDRRIQAHQDPVCDDHFLKVPKQHALQAIAHRPALKRVFFVQGF